MRIALFVLVLVLMATDVDAKQRSRPNIMVILCDDLGYGDIGCFGNKTIKTPNLDKLASQGMRLTACYSASPLCSPARAGLLTGRTPSRVGVYSWIAGNHVMHMPKTEITIAHLLKKAGYQTMHSGKWHCNGKFNRPEQPQPNDHGFDYWFGTQNNAAPTHRNPRNFVRNGNNAGQLKGFSCQIVADEASDWIKNKRDKSRPFFTYVCFHEPHEPIDSPGDLVAMYPEAKKKGEALYYANVSNMDRAVGSLMKMLDDEKLTDNTFVIFTSDNGPETLNRYGNAWRSHGVPGPLRGMKLWMYEGGIRVPGIIRFPGHTKPGQVNDTPVCSVDLLPTFCELAGAEVPKDRKLDGASIMPIFKGQKPNRTTPLYWHYFSAIGQPKTTMRIDDWVILGIRNGPDRQGGPSLGPDDMKIIKESKLVAFELYNLHGDLAQKHNLAEKQPDRLKAMAEKLIAKHREVTTEGPDWDVKPRAKKKPKGK